MITVHSGWASDFSSLGLCPLTPTECTVEEMAGGTYQLKMTHPMDDTGRWLNLTQWNIIKAPAPVRETPLINMGQGTAGATVTRKIYEVRVNSRLRLRTKPSTSTGKIVGRYKNGTRVIQTDVSGDWYQVIVQSGGATGWMHSRYLTYVGEETQTIPAHDTPGKIVEPRQTRDQLFRIVTVERDAAAHRVYVTALHVFYDMAGNIVKNQYAPENAPASEATRQVFDRALKPHEFQLYTNAEGKITGEYTGRSIVSALLETDGIVPQANARLVRDNFDVFVLQDDVRDRGVEIRHGKNLEGAVLTRDVSGVVTTVVPVGRNKDGDPLRLSGDGYIDADNADKLPVPRAKEIEYSVKTGDEGFDTDDKVRTELERLARAEFTENALNQPTVGLDVSFITLERTHQYAAYEHYASVLMAVHLYDIVRVVSPRAGIDAKLRVTGYVYNCLTRQYNSVTLGELYALEDGVSGFDINTGTVSGTKIIDNTMGGEKIRNASVHYAKIAQATIEQLNAQALTAVTARIEKLVADNITADSLYVALATIAVAQITAANIDKANIQWAEIESLNAQIAEIAKAHITDADIDWASIENLNAAIASITQAKIDNATITTAQISDLRAEIAKVITLSAQDGKFDFASIKDLLAQAMILEEGVAGSVMIKNLIATKANFVGATIGELVLQGDDGLYYKVVVQSDGTIRTEQVSVTDGEIAAGQTSDGRQIVATTANVDSLNASDIKAQSAIISDIFTSALTAGSITAQDAFLASATIPELRVTALKALGDTLDISANEQIRLIVGKVDNIQVGGRNLIRDSSMELGTGWNNYSNVSTTDGMDGGACFKVTGALNTTNSVQQLPVIPEGYFKPGEQYVISYWARADNLAYGTTNSLVGLVMEFYSNGTWAGDISLYNQIPAGTRDWTRYSSVVTIPDVAFDMVAPAQVFFRDYTGTVYIDKIQLEKGNQLTDWTSAPEDVDASIQAVANQTAEDMANVVTRIDSDIDNLQSQIDGSITTWFYPVPPTNSNLPAMEWTTTDLKNLHLGDLYYDTVTGYCYRWQVQNNAYSWQRITDTDVTKALADASAAQDTADAKRRVFVSQPVPPYDKGDLWAQGSGGDILRCQTAKIAGQSYAASDWVKAAKYTDDTTANSALAQVGTLQTTVTSQQTEINQTKESIKLLATKSEVSRQINEQSARIDILTDSINSRVEKSTYDQDMDGLREQVSAQYTDFTQTADGMKAEIGELQQDGDALRAYVRYGMENGVGTLSLGQTDSTYKAIVNNTGFTIQQDGSDMTYARKNTLSAPVVEARRVYQQGSYTVKVQADGGLMWN